jgi:hypothetical protein
MKNKLTFRFLLLASCSLLLGSHAFSQDIPLGTWRMHVSYNSIVSVATGNAEVFAAASNGVLVYNRTDQTLQTFTKLSGLTSIGITDVNYDTPTGQLLIAYENGTFDLLHGEEVFSFDPLANSPITGSRRLNRITIEGNLAYLATDYGVLVFDLSRREVKETWRDLGETGETLKIYQSTFKGDSIFLATEKGILAGDIHDNLLDFNAWKRFTQGELNTAVRSIATFDSKVYAPVNNSGLHRYENGIWTKETFLQGLTFSSVSSSSTYLYITENANVWRLDASDQLVQVADDKIVRPLIVKEDPAGALWIGDGEQGLVSNTGSVFKSYLPDGPSVITALRLKYANKKMYLLPGGYSSTFQPAGKAGVLNVFDQGDWQQLPTTVADLTDIDFSTSGAQYVSSFGYGVEAKNPQGDVTVYNEDNSTLINLNPAGNLVNISGVELSADGLWVANYGASSPLHLLKPDNTWQSFAFPIAAARYPLELTVDLFGNTWMVLNPAQGGGLMVFNREENTYRYLTDIDGVGQLPSKSVRSIAVDRDGYVWVGTDIGVAYFFDPQDDAIKPIFESRFLLRDDKVTAIAIDGGNRKWMGTERGVWLFDPTGETLLYNFTTENSPLISNIIQDIEINGETGEVFFATDKGVLSFRGDATESTFGFQTVKIFPNPVTSNFSGTVGITGLATDAMVKITDISGKLIWQTQANGGTATWDARDYNGRRAATGVYLVFCATADGVENAVGKIAVVD